MAVIGKPWVACSEPVECSIMKETGDAGITRLILLHRLVNEAASLWESGCNGEFWYGAAE